jgi:hypothetical protein
MLEAILLSIYYIAMTTVLITIFFEERQKLTMSNLAVSILFAWIIIPVALLLGAIVGLYVYFDDKIVVRSRRGY